MALIAGNKECSEGLAQELHEFFTALKEDGGMEAKDFVEIPVIDPETGLETGEIEQREDTLLKRLCHRLSQIIIDHIKNNLEVHGVEVLINDVTTTVSGTCSGPCSGTGGGTCSGTIEDGVGEGTATGQQSNKGYVL